MIHATVRLEIHDKYDEFLDWLEEDLKSYLAIKDFSIELVCPVCGYGMSFPPNDFHICPCCGTEFGYDDAALSHSELRAEWIGSGAKWFSDSTHPPSGWNALTQLMRVFGDTVYKNDTSGQNTDQDK